LSGWGLAATWNAPNGPTTQANVAFQGSLDEVAIYNSQLTAAQSLSSTRPGKSAARPLSVNHPFSPASGVPMI
jgi:hypothetical protein